MAGESYFIHLAAEFENRFWTFISLVVAIAIFFAEDSPIVTLCENRLPQYVSWSFVTLIVFAVHNYDRSLRRAALTRVPSFRKAAHTESSSAEVVEIMNFLYGIDNPWISTSITSIVILPRVLWLERQIINIFRKATTNNLNQIIAHVELGLIVYKIKDHYWTATNNRTELLRVMCVERQKELSVPSRAMLLDAMQKLNISGHSQYEEFVKNIILNTKLDDLSELKSLTDSKGDFNRFGSFLTSFILLVVPLHLHNTVVLIAHIILKLNGRTSHCIISCHIKSHCSMHKLVFIDIRTSCVRSAILKHIAENAKVQEAHSKISSKLGSQGLYIF